MPQVPILWRHKKLLLLLSPMCTKLRESSAICALFKKTILSITKDVRIIKNSNYNADSPPDHTTPLTNTNSNLSIDPPNSQPTSTMHINPRERSYDNVTCNDTTHNIMTSHTLLTTVISKLIETKNVK